MDELFDVVNEQDEVIGRAPRRQCHGNPALVHRVAHVLVLNRKGELVLQKRSPDKDVQPGKWDTSVGGHVESGEEYLHAAQREMEEELGLVGVELIFLYHSRIRNTFESENVATYLGIHDGPFVAQSEEITEARFWCSEKIDSSLGTGVFTSNFEEEWQMFKTWRRHHSIYFCA